MKKFLLLSLFATASLLLNAQITITDANMPQLGDALPMYSIFEVDGISEGDAGENVVWDYSMMNEESITTFNYIDPTGLPEVSSMNLPGTAEQINTATNGYFYYGTGADANAGDWMRHGFWGDDGSGAIWIAYDSPTKLFDYPMTYESTYTETGYTGSGMMGTFATDIGSTEYTYTCDAYGMLKLPHRIYANAVRVHIQETFEFIADIAGPMVVATVTDDSYYWFVEGVKGPVMSIVYSNTSDFTGGSSDTKTARWYRNPNDPLSTDFFADMTTGNTDDTFAFTNLSSSLSDDFEWTFTPNTVEFLDGTDLNSAHPKVRFTESGLYTASLTATNVTRASVTETKTDYIDIVDAPQLVVDFSGDALTPELNGTCLFTPDVSVNNMLPVTGTTTYEWLVDGNGVDFWPVLGVNYNFVGGTSSTDEIPRVLFMTAGTYRIELTITNSDYSNSPVVVNKVGYIVCGAVGVETTENSSYSIYPNPTTSMITVQVPEISDISIIDISGKVVIKQTISSSESINLGNLNKGVYFVNITSESTSVTKRVILK